MSEELIKRLRIRALSASGRDGAAPAIANQEAQDGR